LRAENFLPWLAISQSLLLTQREQRVQEVWTEDLLTCFRDELGQDEQAVALLKCVR
jgi:hypothetical protein